MKRIMFALMAIVVLLGSTTFVCAETGAEAVIEKSSKRDRELAQYIDKYNDETNGTVAYYLHKAQEYSIPICFVGLAIGALNFFIIGNKKLDKKEQGFGMIVAFLGGLVLFQVLPLVYALLVVGRS